MLRDYQLTARNDVYAAWQAGARNVLLTAATGAGKTVLYSAILQEFNVPAVLIAHRSELVSQSALALNRERVPFSIVAPRATVAEIVRLCHDTHGYSSFAWRAPIRVAGVHTLVRVDPSERWLSTVGLVVVDEAHHCVADNVWGRALAMLPNARVLGVTAHAVRADGQGLGRAADGVFDTLVVGPHGRELINRGFLTDYKMLVPPTDVDFSDVPIGSTGDYSSVRLRAATHKSNRLVGDIVQHYLRAAPGKLGLTFAVDIEAAGELCAAYRRAGVPADIITGETPIAVRAATMRRFRARELLQLVSVDVLGEGTDVPAVEVVSLGRRTASWQLLCQQIGRALRVSVRDELAPVWGSLTDAQRVGHIAASTKPRALVLDHVGNLLLHHAARGFPDSKQTYTLDRRERAARSKSEPSLLRSCLECFQPYERFLIACPYCGAPVPPPAGRSSPEQVDGDLIELDPDVLRSLTIDIARVDGPVRLPAHVDGIVRASITKNHHARYAAQQTMRHAAAVWGGYWRAQGASDREIQKRFYATFGIDVLSMQLTGSSETDTLRARIEDELARLNVTERIV